MTNRQLIVLACDALHESRSSLHSRPRPPLPPHTSAAADHAASSPSSSAAAASAAAAAAGDGSALWAGRARPLRLSDSRCASRRLRSVGGGGADGVLLAVSCARLSSHLVL